MRVCGRSCSTASGSTTRPRTSPAKRGSTRRTSRSPACQADVRAPPSSPLVLPTHSDANVAFRSWCSRRSPPAPATSSRSRRQDGDVLSATCREPRDHAELLPTAQYAPSPRADRAAARSYRIACVGADAELQGPRNDATARVVAGKLARRRLDWADRDAGFLRHMTRGLRCTGPLGSTAIRVPFTLTDHMRADIWAGVSPGPTWGRRRDARLDA